MLKRLVSAGLLICVAGAAFAQGTATTPVEMKTTQDTKLYYAPDKQIGVLKTGTQVKVIKEQGDWAFVRYVSDKIVVQGWVEKKYLTPVTEAQVDPLRGLDKQKN